MPSVFKTTGFRPRARILRTLGDELISSEAVAAGELVKNSYDADAFSVLIRFTGPLTAGAGLIEVIDDGCGMTEEIVRTAFLEPATPNRRTHPYSTGLRRRVLGEKGIGRFAAARLANTLEVITRQATDPEETVLRIDWTAFDNVDKYLDEIEVECLIRPAVDIAPGGALDSPIFEHEENPTGNYHGTILRLYPLRSTWNADSIQDLRRSLARIVSPFTENAQLDAFKIYIELPKEFSHLAGRVDPPALLTNPQYQIVGFVESDGSYNLEVRTTQNDHEELSGRFGLKHSKTPQCGPFDVDIRVWDRDAGALKSLADVWHSKVSNVRRDLDDAAGISIYRDGFRVLPYGDPKNDWLRLDLRRVQNPTLRLSNNQIVGYIQISNSSNPGLRDQSNREGLIETQELADFRELILLVLSQLEVKRYAARRQTSDARATAPGHGLFSGFDLEPLVTYVQHRHGSDVELMRAVEHEQAAIAKRIEHVRTVIARYTGLATLGSLIDTVLHDGRAPVAGIKNEADIGALEATKLSKEVNGRASRLAERFKRISTDSGLLATVFRKIEPFGGRKRGRPAEVELEKIIADAFRIFESALTREHVKITLPSSRTIVRVDSAEIAQVFINLVQNSLYWLTHVPAIKREISVSVTRNDGSVEIVFSDSGPGVPADIADKIFEPYFSYKPDGVGLGLSIAGEVLHDYYDGRIELVDSGPLSGATFRISLGRRV